MWAFIDTQEKPPLISIIMPVYNVQACWLRQALDSLSSQSWPWWEACVADDASTDPGVGVLREYMQRDRRIKVAFRAHNGHIAAASNTALEMARGDFVALMDHDDLLPETALYFVAREILEHPEADLIYSDEDKIDEEGYRFAHYFKPDYNPDLMLSHNMVCHFGVYRRRLVSEIGGFREGYEGAQDYDLALRAIARIGPERIRHIPRILYHWRLLPESTASGIDAKPYAMDAAIRAVSENLKQRGIEAQVTESPLIQGMLRVKYALPEHPPLVSIIIPTRNGLALLQRCIESLLEKTRYPHFEIIVVDNDSDDPATLAYLDRQAEAGRIRVVAYPEPFNFSAINNYAVTHCQGELLAFLNNDLEVISEDWLGEMVSHAVRPETGAVGARLWYPDDRLQHAGVVLGLGGVAGHAMKYLPRVDKGYNARAVLVQDYSAVTAACLVVRREIFDQVEGFDEAHLGVAFNDVDLCLRILELGYRNLWTPFAEFYHHESASRGLEDTPEKQARFGAEIDYMKKRWGPSLQRDPAYNPNLTHAREDFSLQN
jgi:glycosyltransferase involved in cell wall biosynthesis